MQKQKITVGTHAGKFHADEVFAIAMLMLIFIVNVIRIPRNKEDLFEMCDMLLDIGYVYDFAKWLFDHHQNDVPPRANGIPYATFGLVWMHFGVQACGGNQIAADLVEKRLVQPIDAYDCGHHFYDVGNTGVAPYHVSHIIERMNGDPQPDGSADPNQENHFLDAIEMAGNILEAEIRRALHEAPVVAQLQHEITEPQEIPGILVLRDFCHWKEVLPTLDHNFTFVCYPTQQGNWALQTIQIASGVHKAIKNLPASWAGKRGQELVEITGVKGVKFCHAARFLAQAKTKNQILALAQLALNEPVQITS